MPRAEDKVVIRNIYHMMAYAFNAIHLKEYSSVETEEFEHVDDLLAAILSIGIASRLRCGLEHGYAAQPEDLLGIRGRIDLTGTARLRATGRRSIRCLSDEWTADTQLNRILKCSAGLLIQSKEISIERKNNLRKLYRQLDGISNVSPSSIDWSRLSFHNGNRGYRLLMGVCRIVIESVLPTTDTGETPFGKWRDKQRLSALFEHFVLEYFRSEHSGLKATAHHVPPGTTNAPNILPALITDVTLTGPDRVLIIDCKCYGTILRENMGKEILAPAHRNQIYSYVAHESWSRTERPVEGMLLYALTDDARSINESWNETGFRFHCQTLDLGKDFSEIRGQLDKIATIVE